MGLSTTIRAKGKWVLSSTKRLTHWSGSCIEQGWKTVRACTSRGTRDEVTMRRNSGESCKCWSCN